MLDPVILSVAVLIIVIVAIVSCYCCCQDLSAAKRRKPTYVVSYPTQPQSTDVPAAATGVANTTTILTSPTPAQQYPPPVNISALPASALPTAPLTFGAAPPAYEEIAGSSKNKPVDAEKIAD